MTVLLLTVGSLLLPVVGWLIGCVMLWTSERWTRGDKLLGTMVWPGGYLGVLLLGTIPAQTCFTTSSGAPGAPTSTQTTCQGVSLPPTAGVALLLVTVVAPIVVAVILYGRASRRARADTRIAA